MTIFVGFTDRLPVEELLDKFVADGSIVCPITVARLVTRSRKKFIRRLSEHERGELAKTARYVGSAEHKVKRSWLGLPRGKQLKGGRVGRPGSSRTTICPLTTEEDRDRATHWVQEAIRTGQYEFVASDQKYPKKVWYKDGDQTWEGYCINTIAGEYKGWPIKEDNFHEAFG